MEEGGAGRALQGFTTETRRRDRGPDVKELRTNIGKRALKNDWLETHLAMEDGCSGPRLDARSHGSTRTLRHCRAAR